MKIDSYGKEAFKLSALLFFNKLFYQLSCKHLFCKTLHICSLFFRIIKYPNFRENQKII